MELVFAKADQIFDIVASHSPLWIYLFVLLSMIIENIIPPFPGDTIIFVCGVYAAGGHISWGLVYWLSVIGTLISVMFLYYLGRSKGRKVFLNPSARWLGVERLAKVEHWFDRWGDKVLILSRWLSGIRALLALSAGVGNVRTLNMFVYSLISTLTWNFAVLFLALKLRQDWHRIDIILATYGWAIIIGVLLIIAGYIVRNRLHRRSNGA